MIDTSMYFEVNRDLKLLRFIKNNYINTSCFRNDVKLFVVIVIQVNSTMVLRFSTLFHISPQIE